MFWAKQTHTNTLQFGGEVFMELLVKWSCNVMFIAFAVAAFFLFGHNSSGLFFFTARENFNLLLCFFAFGHPLFLTNFLKTKLTS